MKLLAVALNTSTYRLEKKIQSALFFIRTMFPPIVFGLLFFISYNIKASVCTPDWKITGYYSPIETDFTDKKNSRVFVNDIGPMNFNQYFVEEVKLNGWGRTRFGWYLGYYAQKWHKSNTPLDAQGKHLQLGAVAIDRQFLKMGNKIVIPKVNDIVGVSEFVASDVGSAIKKKHIDVYTGEGKLARKVSWKVTGRNQVCITSI